MFARQILVPSLERRGNSKMWSQMLRHNILLYFGCRCTQYDVDIAVSQGFHDAIKEVYGFNDRLMNVTIISTDRDRDRSFDTQKIPSGKYLTQNPVTYLPMTTSLLRVILVLMWGKNQKLGEVILLTGLATITNIEKRDIQLYNLRSHQAWLARYFTLE